MPEREPCRRCWRPLTSSVVSYFNTDVICLACSDDERQAPGFRAAVDREVAACKAGDYNFPGVGLSPEDQAFLVARRAARGAR